MWLLTLLVSGVFADSPLTSPPLYVPKHADPLVVRALETSELDEEMMAQLSRRWTPIHRKAAIVSALGWDVDGQSNAVLYLGWLDEQNRRVNARQLAGGEGLRPDEQLALGYLMAMDDYFEPERALPLLSLAQDALPRSRTVAWVHALVSAQVLLPSDWCAIWTLTEHTRDRPELNTDLPEEVEQGLLSYLQFYAEYCPPEVEEPLMEEADSPAVQPASDPSLK